MTKREGREERRGKRGGEGREETTREKRTMAGRKSEKWKRVVK
jgi:hypothetical protein